LGLTIEKLESLPGFQITLAKKIKEGIDIRKNWLESIFSQELESAKNLKLVKDVRNIGAIGVIELVDDCYAQKVQEYCVNHGVWIRPFGKLVYSIVAYTIDEIDLRKVVKTMINAIKNIEENNEKK
jgi:adenosylmethionine-8-amino-7-oxononanoate aminotransferase